MRKILMKISKVFKRSYLTKAIGMILITSLTACGGSDDPSPTPTPVAPKPVAPKPVAPKPVVNKPVSDKDKDGIADSKDNCPNVANKDQKDSNKDKKGDACSAPKLSVKPSTTNLLIGGTKTSEIKALLSNSKEKVVWTLSGAGSLSNTTGNKITYTPPKAGSPESVTITAKAGSLSEKITIQLKDIIPEFSYFSANDGNGVELFKTNGKADGTSIVKNINASGNSNPAFFKQFGTKTVFTAADATNGDEIWITDGTEAGTQMVKDINSGAPSSSPEGYTTLGNKLLFVARTAAAGVEPWITDGTKKGTVQLKNIHAGAASSMQIISNIQQPFTIYKGKAYFTANEGSTGTQRGIELWVTDGTTAGTELVADIDKGTNSSNPANLTVFKDKLYFTASDSQEQPSSAGVELYSYDGSKVTRVSDVNNAGNSNPSQLTVMGDNLYFVATDASGDTELMKTDGTTVSLVKNINPTTGIGSNINNLTAVGNTLYFSANAGNDASLKDEEKAKGQELWMSNGTAAGTKLVTDINTSGNSNPNQFKVLNNQLYFFANSSTFGTELHTVNDNGVAVVLKDIVSGSASSTPFALMLVNGKLFFQAKTLAEGIEPYISDGTAKGTVLIKDINSGAGDSTPFFTYQK